MKTARGISLIAAVGLTVSMLTACAGLSVPNLEPAACTEARDHAKRFYSLHFGGSLAPSVEDLKKKEPLITPLLYRRLESRTENPEDYFTATADYPKAFRIGSCEMQSEDRVVFGILLFWRDDKRSEQREIKTTLVRSVDKWLVDEVAGR